MKPLLLSILGCAEDFYEHHTQEENPMKKDRSLRLCTALVIFMSIVFPGCSDDSNPGLLRVRVVNGDGQAIADSTVVLGNSDGSMITSGTTGATGIVRFANPPNNATVTAGIHCQAYSRTYYFLAATYDVNISELTLMLNDCSEGEYGTLNVNVADGLSGIAYREVTVGGLTYGGDSHSFSFEIGSYFFQSDGKFTLVAVGYDANDRPVGYGLLLDQTFSDGMTVDVTIDKTDLAQIEYLMENTPQSAVQYILANPITRKGADTYVFSIWGEAPVPAWVTIPYILDFGESYRFTATLDIDRDGDEIADSEIGIIRKSLTQSNQTFDFSKTPLIPTNLAFSMTKPDCPTISWNEADASAQFVGIFLYDSLTVPVKSYFSYSFVLPPSRTSIVFPQLPETLAAFRPTGFRDLDISTYNYDIYSGYDDYLRKTDMYYSGRYEEPAESALAFSETWISGSESAKGGSTDGSLPEMFTRYVQGRNAGHLLHLKRSVRMNEVSP